MEYVSEGHLFGDHNNFVVLSLRRFGTFGRYIGYYSIWTLKKL